MQPRGKVTFAHINGHLQTEGTLVNHSDFLMQPQGKMTSTNANGHLWSEGTLVNNSDFLKQPQRKITSACHTNVHNGHLKGPK